MPPFVQEVFERFDRVIGCGHVSGLFVRPDLAAGRYGDARILRFSRNFTSCGPLRIRAISGLVAGDAEKDCVPQPAR
jgi:hypothetical protein